jgi:subtilisin family serine protease
MYTSASEDVDEYAWNNPDFLILFSAGNDGKDLDGDGVVDLYSMGAPATAKNCLTVGASEGDRPSGAGCDNNWSHPRPNDYSAYPISFDHVSDDPGGMAAFSSRGPVLDGRYKPDLVAPGTNILSTRSSVTTKTGWGKYDSSYMWMGGTSMSTPLSAGAAALMREYLIKQKGFPNPSAALIKAALLNSAEDISPGQYGTGAFREIPDQPAPNNVEGWGRLNLANGVYPVSPFDILYYYEEGSDSLSAGGFREYTVRVSDSGSPLKINLVWTDYPGSPSAQGGLVNDLDLQVTDPSSRIHYCDNASQKSALALIAYDDGKPEFYYNCNKIAVRFTPSAYPANVESTTFLFDNPDDRTTDVDIVVYNDSSGGLPGAQLFKKTLTYLPSGCVTIGITGVVISSGDFYIAI